MSIIMTKTNTVTTGITEWSEMRVTSNNSYAIDDISLCLSYDVIYYYITPHLTVSLSASISSFLLLKHNLFSNTKRRTTS